MFWIRVVLWTMLSGTPAFLLGQFDLNSYPVTVVDGLPSNTIYCIEQDEDGAIWIGHERGLTRFNGLGFKNYFMPQGEIALAGIAPLGGDSVLARTFRGESVLCTVEGLTPIQALKRPQNGFPSFKIGKRSRLATHGNEILWIGRNLTVELFPLQVPVVIHDALLGRDSTLYVFGDVGGFVGVSVLDLNTGVFTNLHRVTSFSRGLFFQWGNAMFCYLVGEGKILRLLRDRVETLPTAGIADGLKGNQIVELNDDIAAIATFTGLVLIDQQGRLLGHYLKDYAISWMFKDRSGNLWLGTLEDGIRIVPSLDLTRLDMARYYRNAKLYSHAFVGRDTLLLGTYDGKVLWVNSFGEFLRTTDFDLAAEIQALWVDRNRGVFWAFADGLYSVDLRSGRVGHRQEVTSTKVIRSFGDRIFCGTSKGLFILHQGEFEQYLGLEWIVGLEIDDEGGLLILGREGTYRLDLQDAGAEPVEMGFGEGIPAIFSQVQKRSSDLLLLAPRTGIYRWRKGKMDRLLSLDRQGLEDITRFHPQGEMIWGLSRDRIWVHDGEWRNYDFSQGVMDGDLRDVELVNHTAYIFSSRAVLRVNKLPGSNQTPTGLYLRHAETTYSWIKGAWRSKHAGNRLHLGLEALPNMGFKRKVRIQYQLSGQDSLWREADVTDSLQWIRLDRLEEGAYSLSVRAVDSKGDATAHWTVSFVVEPPFYARWWFWLVCLAVTGLVVYGFVLWRIAILKRKNMEKIQKERLKIQVLTSELKAIRSQMNPHFIFNTLSAIQAKVLSQEAEAAYEDLASFSKLLRAVLDYSGREYLSLDEEIGFLENYLKLESNRFGDRFQWEIQVDEELRGASVRIPTLITQPFIENALRHGLLHKEGDKRLKIACSGTPEDFRIVIIDNGVGRKMASEINADRPGRHRSFAIQATEQRIEYLRQSKGPKISLEIRDLTQGTEVNIRIQDE